MAEQQWRDAGVIPPDEGERILGGIIDYYAENRGPRLMHPDWLEAAEKKLAELEKRTGKKPNFLVYILDDVGWGDFGCYGGGHLRGAPTPNFDRLAADGLRLTSCYSQPSCSPSRATLMTGRLPIRHGILTPPMYGQPGGLQDEVTLPELLSKAGYATRAVGKWHCGENAESVPQNKGFDEFYGFYGVSDMYTEWRDNYFYPEIVNDPLIFNAVMNAKFNKHNILAKAGQFDTPEIEQEEIDLETVKDLDEKWADYSEKFIRMMAGSNKPWFLYHGTRGCHFDNYPPDKFKGKSRAKYPFHDVLVEMDDIFGRLFTTLEETGQLENTLIFVTSDNGPEMESWPDSSYTPFRGSKGTTWEGGIRIPGIFFWKGMIEAGRASDGKIASSYENLPGIETCGERRAGRTGRAARNRSGAAQKRRPDGRHFLHVVIGQEGQREVPGIGARRPNGPPDQASAPARGSRDCPKSGVAQRQIARVGKDLAVTVSCQLSVLGKTRELNAN